MLWIIGAAVVVIALWYYFMKPLRYWSDRGVRQTKPWIFIGDSWMNLFRTMGVGDFIDFLYYMYPNERYMGFYNFTNPVLLLRDPEVIKQITVKGFDAFTDHSPFVDAETDPMWNSTLFTLKGERWREMRNVLTPTFTSSKIKSIFVLVVETAENFLNYFDEKNEEVIELDLKDAYTRYTNDIIATTAFGVKVDSLQDKKNTFYQMGKRITDVGGVINGLKIFSFFAFPKLAKILGFTFLDPLAAKYFHNVVNDTIKIREEKKIVRPDMLNLLLEARKSQSNGVDRVDGKPKAPIEISNFDITAQAVIFFFAGFDTVSRAMSFGSYELAIHKDIQDRLREEIVEVAKKGKVTYDALQEMTYMDMVVSETLRKWPPFPTIDRVCTKNNTIEPADDNHKPIHLKQGVEIWLPVYALQRDPKYFPDPEKFDPERFSEKNKKNIVPYTYMPFGVGPRLCIGNRFALIEIKALLFHLLLKYEIVPTKKTPIPLVLEPDFQLEVKGGFQMGLKRIKS